MNDNNSIKRILNRFWKSLVKGRPEIGAIMFWFIASTLHYVDGTPKWWLESLLLIIPSVILVWLPWRFTIDFDEIDKTYREMDDDY